MTDPPLQASGGSAESPGQEVFDHEEALYGLFGLQFNWQDFEKHVQFENDAGSFRYTDKTTLKLSIIDSGKQARRLGLAEAKFVRLKLYATEQLLRYLKIAQALGRTLTIHTTATALSEKLKAEIKAARGRVVQWKFDASTGRFVETGVDLLKVFPVLINMQQIQNSILGPQGQDNQVRIRVPVRTKDRVTSYCRGRETCAGVLF